jgi:hypothetical protein
MVELAKLISDGMIQSVSGRCMNCGHHFEWVLIRGKAFIHKLDTLIAAQPSLEAIARL